MNRTSTRPRTARRPLALAGAAALAGSLLLAAPAHATTSGGCSVVPLSPVFAGFNSSGVKQVNYRVRISCAQDRSVTVLQRRYEDDVAPDPDDLTGSSTFTRSFSAANTITVSVVRSLPDTESGSEEIYHTVRFRVSSNGVTSAWTASQRSAIVSMPN